MTATPHNQGLCEKGDDCFGCKVGSLAFSSTGMPTRKPDANMRRQSEKIMLKDVESYRRLRYDGYQPPATKGAAELESRAGSKWEIETGQNLNGDVRLGNTLQEVSDAMNDGSFTM